MIQAGMDAAQLLQWLGQLSNKEPGQGQQVQLLERVWNENFELDPSGQTQQRQAQPPGAVHNPHDPEAQWAAKGQGKHKRNTSAIKSSLKLGSGLLIIHFLHDAPEQRANLCVLRHLSRKPPHRPRRARILDARPIA